MKEYDVIAIGTGSAMNIIPPYLRRNPNARAAVIDKDEPGGICLTRGCIPTKILVYPAEVIRTIQDAHKLGIDVNLKGVDFKKVMARMHGHIDPTINSIRKGLSQSPDIDYYPAKAEFTAPYTLKVGDETITSKFILLCLGSEVAIPPVDNRDGVAYHTSDTILGIDKLPDSIAIIGGGYIAAEYGHFFSAMGSDVTVIGRNPRILPKEEPEVSELAQRVMSNYMKVHTNQEVLRFVKGRMKSAIVARDRTTGKEVEHQAEAILIATGRRPNTDILHPERAGIETDERGWIKVNEHLETSQPGIWAFGDAIGKHQFKHVANYESLVVYYNAVLGKNVKADYHAVPSAVFGHPEVASVGMGEAEAIQKFGENKISIGFQRYEDTAKGGAMAVKDYFVKVILENHQNRILGAHIIGPQASVLIQEIINLMYTSTGSADPISRGMHIHPALSEVVERAFQGPMPPRHYHGMREHGHHH